MGYNGDIIYDIISIYIPVVPPLYPIWYYIPIYGYSQQMSTTYDIWLSRLASKSGILPHMWPNLHFQKTGLWGPQIRSQNPKKPYGCK